MRYYCGTPQDQCIGSFCKEGLQSKHKLHSSIQEAMLCFKRHIQSLGFVQDKILKNKYNRKPDEPSKYLDRKVG